MFKENSFIKKNLAVGISFNGSTILEQTYFQNKVYSHTSASEDSATSMTMHI
jgi:hypothetical protein